MDSKEIDSSSQEVLTSSIIKKNRPSKNLRKRIEDNDEEDLPSEIKDKESLSLNDILTLQSLRGRKNGLSAEALLTGPNKSKSLANKNDDSSAITEKGSGLNIPYQSLMEKYVEAKLGLKNDIDIVKNRPDDELYRVPEELKVESDNNSKVQIRFEDENGQATSWSTGIAEVALPMSYKLKNIEETEARLHAINEEYSDQNQNQSRYQRFQIFDNPVKTVSKPGIDNQSATNNNKRSLTSTDDQAFQAYKKRMFERK